MNRRRLSITSLYSGSVLKIYSKKISPTGVVLAKRKIVATVGPACSSPESIESLIKNGVDVFRLNFSHGSHEDHKQIFEIIRRKARELSAYIGIICDIQGPKIRIGKVESPFFVATDDIIRITSQDIIGNKNRISIQYPDIHKDLGSGDIIFVNDGIVQLEVIRAEDEDLVCKVLAGGQISDHKGCNLPTGNVRINILSEKDKEDLTFICQELKPEFIAASFVGSSKDIEEVRSYLAKYDSSDIKVIAKIERPVAVENMDEIVSCVDGIMVARGDLGVEIPPHLVPIVQKELITKANRKGIPVIVATQMLESMTINNRPTRAEASDVFNAIEDGADAVMLSGETSVGKYPVETVLYMNNIITAAEDSIPDESFDTWMYDEEHGDDATIIGHSISGICRLLKKTGKFAKVVIPTQSGYTVRTIAKFKPKFPIIALTPTEKLACELNLSGDVWPEYIPDLTKHSTKDLIKKLISLNVIKPNEDDTVVIAKITEGVKISIIDMEKYKERELKTKEEKESE